MAGTLHEEQCKFMIVSHRVVLKIKNIPDRQRRENENTHSILNKFFLKIVPFMKLCGGGKIQLEKQQMTI